MDNYCFTDIGQTIKSLNTSVDGLSAEEAEKRLKTYGRNELEKTKKAGIVKLFFSQFKDFYDLAFNCRSRGVGCHCLSFRR